MKFELKFERFYPYPVVQVWGGLTSNEALGDWLMDTTGFKAEVGQQFEMTCADRDGQRDVYRCRVIEIDAPFGMRWSWVLVGREQDGTTEVEFRLEAAGDGTVVTVFHRGGAGKSFVDDFKSGWPGKLDALQYAIPRRRD